MKLPPAMRISELRRLRRTHARRSAGHARASPRSTGYAVTWRFPPFSCSRSQPRSSLPEVGPDAASPPPRSPARSCTPARLQQRPIAEADQRPPCRSGRGAPRLGRRQHQRRALRHDVLRAPHEAAGFTGSHLVDHQPGRRAPRSRPGAAFTSVTIRDGVSAGWRRGPPHTARTTSPHTEPRATRTARTVPASSPEPAAARRPRRPPRAADSAGPGADCRLRSRQPTS